MSINLPEVFTTFATKYDKQNILSYVGILFFLSLLVAIVGIKSISGIVLSIIIYIIVTTLYLGYYAVASHNEANNLKSAFPSIMDLNNIIVEGIKYSFGMFSISLIAYSLPTLIVFFLIMSCFTDGFNPSFFIIAIIGCLILFLLIFLLGYFIVIPLQLMFLKSLNFNDFFAFGKLKTFRKQKGGQYLIFFLFTILVNMVISVVGSIATFVTAFASGIAKMNSAEIYEQLLNLFVTMVLYTLLLPNLNGQILKYDVANEPQEDYEYLEEDNCNDEEDV